MNIKQVKFLSILIFSFVLKGSCQNRGKNNIGLLSDQIPTDTPLVFASGIISTDSQQEGSQTWKALYS